MATFQELIAKLRADAERRAEKPTVQEFEWSRPGEWWDVFGALDELEAALNDPSVSRDRLALLAFVAGEAQVRAQLRLNLSPTIDVGDRVKRGGVKGAARAHGPHAARAQARDGWCRRYGELRTKFPEAPKKTLLGIIAEETDEKPRTLRRYIKQR